MMKIVGSNQWRCYAISRVSRSAFFSSESHSQEDSLFKRISGLKDPSNSATTVIDRWVQEGRELKIAQLQEITEQLRQCHRHTHALQIQEYINDQKNKKPTPEGMIARLNLISKVYGIDKAEKYFYSIPVSLRSEEVYGAMLSSYAAKRSSEKVDELFRKMNQLGFVKSVSSYNMMLGLYSRAGNHEKLDNLIQEMQEKGIKGDNSTFCILLNAYATTNLEKMEKLLTKLEAESLPAMDFHIYSVAAKGYLSAGLIEKSLTVIRKAEKRIGWKANSGHFEHLLALYGATGNKNEVYRIWNLYKKKGVLNNGYLSVISSLVKLEDIDGAEKIFDEWVSGSASFDSRIASFLMSTYCKKGLLEKAFAFTERLTSEGHKLNAGTWQRLASFCCVEGQMAKAVETLKKALSVGDEKWRLNRASLFKCLEHLKKEGDTETSHEILKSLRKIGNVSDDLCDRLVDFVNGDKESIVLDAMKDDTFEREAEPAIDANTSI